MAFRLAVQNKESGFRQSFFYEQARVLVAADGDLAPEGFKGEFEISENDNAYSIINSKGSLKNHGEEVVLSQVTDLKSGAELVSENFVFNFYISHKRVRMSKKNSMMGMIAKVLMVLVVLVELFVVFVLPKRAKSSQLFVKSELRGRSVLLLDKLRKQADDRTELYKNSSPVIQGLIKLMKVNLDKTAWYVRENADYLNLEEMEAVYKDLQTYQKLIDRLKNRQDLDKLPSLDEKILLQKVYQKIRG